jgi:hypothetical protein
LIGWSNGPAIAAAIQRLENRPSLRIVCENAAGPIEHVSGFGVYQALTVRNPRT